MYDFYSWGLPVGTVARIRIRIHWLLLAYWVFELDKVLRVDPEYRSWVFLGWGISAGLLFGSILLHEFGHCFAARHVGGEADEILMWPLGGLAFCHCPDFWKSHLIVAAAGPAVSLAIAGVSYGAFALSDASLGEVWARYPRLDFFANGVARSMLVDFNLIILVFNLMPLYPLDGGRIFHSALWGWFSRQGGYVWGGRSRATRVTLVASRITAVVGLAWAAYAGRLLLGAIFLWALLNAERLRETD